MALDAVANFVKVTVSQGYDQHAYSIVLNSGQGAKMPAPPFNLTWYNATDYPDPSDDPNVEIVRVTNVAGDTLTLVNDSVSRQPEEGTVATTKNTAGKTYKLGLDITAKMITDIAAAILAGAPSLKFIQVTGTIPGTAFTLASAKTGQSIIIQNNTTFVEGVDYTVSGLSLTWLYNLPSPYTSPLTLICVG